MGKKGGLEEDVPLQIGDFCRFLPPSGFFRSVFWISQSLIFFNIGNPCFNSQFFYGRGHLDFVNSLERKLKVV